MEQITHEQLEKVVEQLHDTTVTLTSTTQMLRSHIQEQRGLNTRVDQLMHDQEHRIRHLEQWRSGVDARLPESFVDPGEAAAQFKRVDEEIAANRQLLTTLNDKFDDLGRVIARWGGIAAGVLVVVEIVLKVIL